jgi:hypothetical protein
MGTGYCGGLAMRRMSPTDPSWPTVYPAALFINIFGILQCLTSCIPSIFWKCLDQDGIWIFHYPRNWKPWRDIFYLVRNHDPSLFRWSRGQQFCECGTLGSASNLSLGSGSGFEMRIRILLQYINVSNESWNIPRWQSFRKSKILCEFYENVFFWQFRYFILRDIFAVHLEFR